MDTAGAEETLTSVASILEKMVQSGVPHLVPARYNGKSEKQEDADHTLSTKSSLNQNCNKKIKGPRFLDLAVLWGLPVRGHPQLRRNVGRPPIGAALQSKSFPSNHGQPFCSASALRPFQVFQPGAKSVHLIRKLLNSTILLGSVCLAAVKKIPGGNVPDEKTPCSPFVSSLAMLFTWSDFRPSSI